MLFDLYSSSLLPLALLVVVLGRQAVDGVHLHVDHALQLSLLPLRRESDWQWSVHC